MRFRTNPGSVRRLPFACLPWMLLVCCIGCGDGRPARVPVAGRVLLNGEPLPLGHVRFVPDDARPSGGQIGPDGRFQLTCFDGSDGAVPGRHRVEVVANRLEGNTLVWYAPRELAGIETSGLEFEITGPTDDLLIELQTDQQFPLRDPSE